MEEKYMSICYGNAETQKVLAQMPQGGWQLKHREDNVGKSRATVLIWLRIQ